MLLLAIDDIGQPPNVLLLLHYNNNNNNNIIIIIITIITIFIEKGRSLRVGSNINCTCSLEKICACVGLKWFYY